MSKPTEPGLERRLGLATSFNLVVANMVGTGIFTTSGLIMAEITDPLTLLACWLCGGVLALAGALCYGELGANLPRSGGEYAFLTQSMGPAFGFLSGWVSLVVGFSAPIAASAMAFAAYLGPLAGLGGEPWVAWQAGGVTLASLSPQGLLALGVILLLALVHIRGLELGARVQNWLTGLKLALLLALLGAGFFLGEGSWSHLADQPASPGLLSGEFAVSLIFVSFAYSGWNAAAYLGGEIKDPARNIPRALALGAGAVAAIYLAMNLLYLYALPPAEMAGVVEVGGKAATALFGPRVGGWFSLAIALGLLSVLSSMILTGPRVYFAMARDGLFFASLGRVNPEHHAPSRAIVLQAVLAMIMVLTASFGTLLVYIGFTLSLCALLTVVGLMRLRTQGRMTAAYRTPAYPLTPLAFIGLSLWMMIYSLISIPVAAVAGLITISVGLAVYLWFRRGAARA